MKPTKEELVRNCHHSTNNTPTRHREKFWKGEARDKRSTGEDKSGRRQSWARRSRGRDKDSQNEITQIQKEKHWIGKEPTRRVRGKNKKGLLLARKKCFILVTKETKTLLDIKARTATIQPTIRQLPLSVQPKNESASSGMNAGLAFNEIRRR